jgi:hypothetical protein
MVSDPLLAQIATPPPASCLRGTDGGLVHAHFTFRGEPGSARSTINGPVGLVRIVQNTAGGFDSYP